jgi:hypothetical protein
MKSRHGSYCCGLVLALLPLASSAPAAGIEVAHDPVAAREAIERGIAYLLTSQNADGSWGGAWDSLTTWSGEVWSNPESHRSWRVATTGLCYLALRETGHTDAANAAQDHALDYLIANALVKRPNEWDTMDCWAHIYGLQALAAAYADPRCSARRESIRRAAETHLASLAYSQSLGGGWGYLEFRVPRTARPQWATSFTTAAGVVALVEAQRAGLDVDEGLLQRALKAVKRCRLPNGAYTYAVQAITHPRRIGSIDRINGSLGRIQACNLARLMAGDEVPADELRVGIDHFFREHRFLDIAAHKPVPHEAFYQNSGYFYFFGHYYAARIIGRLPAEERTSLWPQLRHEIIKMQQEDGSMWDYDHHAYDRPYGTAYGIMALQRSLGDVRLSDVHAGPATR